MIPSANYYEFVNCPIRPKGTSLSDLNSCNFTRLEEWLWLEEAIRTGEIRASAQVDLKSARYTKSMTKANVARIMPERSTIDSWVERLNAIANKEFVSSIRSGTHVGPSYFQVFESSTIPVETTSQLEARVTRSTALSPLSPFQPSIMLNRSMLRIIENRAKYFTTFGARDARIFLTSNLKSVVNWGTFLWHRNGTASESPEKERLSGLFDGAPFLQYDSTYVSETANEKHLAQMYFRVAYADADVGSRDLTYTYDGERMSYVIPSTPWNFNKSGRDDSVCDVFIRVGWIVYQNSVWKIKVNGSNNWMVTHGGSGIYAAYNNGFSLSGSNKDNYLSMWRSLADEARDVCDKLKLENMAATDPRVNYGTITEKKRIGNQWYVEPAWALIDFRPNPRVID